uniref:KIB1-4 beta-propeller domain-containing protein n=1 Tax=Leersia perrieri TaxID=77586 RepID=A0A0D9V0D7_9ORYZ
MASAAIRGREITLPWPAAAIRGKRQQQSMSTPGGWNPSDTTCLPSLGSKCIVVLIHNPWNQLSFARIGDPTWTWLTAQSDCLGYHDCLFDENDGFALCLAWAPVVNSICDGLMLSFNCVNYIVRAPWGDLLLVWRQLDLNGDADPTTIEVTVFKIEVTVWRQLCFFFGNTQLRIEKER